MKNKLKWITALIILSIINSSAFAQRGRSVNSNSIIKNLPRINTAIKANPKVYTNVKSVPSTKNSKKNQAVIIKEEQPKDKVKAADKNKPSKKGK